MDEVMNAGDSERNVYELGFLLVPDITEEKLPEAFGAIKDVVMAKGAVAISEEFPKAIGLAYTMEKTINNKIERYSSGYFSWIKFELDGGSIEALNAELRLRPDIIRFLLISTVRENTIAQKRPLGVRRRSGAEKKDPNAPEMTKEEIDREIEALVEEKTVTA